MEKVSYKNYEIEIETCDCADDPLTWDNLGKLYAYKHRRYTFGNEQFDDFVDLMEEIAGVRVEDHPKVFERSSHEISKWIFAQAEKVAIIIPVYMYEHSGIALSTSRGGQFSDRFDSGTLGYMFAKKDEILKEYSASKITPKLRDKVLGVLEGQVETYGNFVSGDVYRYSINDSLGNDIDSCGGFFGYDHKASGLLEYAENAIDSHIATERKKRFGRIKTWIKNRVPLMKRQELAI